MIGLVKISSSKDARGTTTMRSTKHTHGRAGNYYIDERANLVWQGKGEEILGIAGEQASKEQFVALPEGRVPNPVTGQMQDLSAKTPRARIVAWAMTSRSPRRRAFPCLRLLELMSALSRPMSRPIVRRWLSWKSTARMCASRMLTVTRSLR